MQFCEPGPDFFLVSDLMIITDGNLLNFNGQKMQVKRTDWKRHSPLLDRLKAIYAKMDQQYAEAAAHYGFHCSGCVDNCCLTRFYHHTFLEYFYVSKGYETLDPENQAAVAQRASEVCAKTAEADEKGEKVRLMCPLNACGLCLLYDYRPMICRLHGISHELHRPGQGIIHSPGCEAFTEQSEGKGYFKFDRTPFYLEMAGLERELKQTVGIMQKLKMTIAQMLLADDSHETRPHGQSRGTSVTCPIRASAYRGESDMSGFLRHVARGEGTPAAVPLRSGKTGIKTRIRRP